MKFEYKVIGLGCGFLAVLAGSVVYGAMFLKEIYQKEKRLIPRAENIQQGFASPNKLEILARDVDHNGQPELYLKYDGVEYLLMLNANGIPEIRPYELKPAELIPK